MRSIASELDVEALEKAGLKFVIIGMGSHTLIGPYRSQLLSRLLSSHRPLTLTHVLSPCYCYTELTGTNVAVFPDPTLTLHHTLGMTLRTTSAGPASERGHYVSSPPSLARALRDAVTRHRMLPLFEKAGDAAQLGGEFILGPGLGSEGGCHYAHRMRTTRGHAPILDVVERSGVVTAWVRRFRKRGGLAELGVGMDGGVYGSGRRESMEDEEAWMARRRRSLVRLKRKRAARRNGIIGASVVDGAPPVVTVMTVKSAHVPKEKKSMETLLTKRVSVVAEGEEPQEEEADVSFEKTLTQ